MTQVEYRAIIAVDEKALNERLCQMQQRYELEVVSFSVSDSRAGVLVKLFEEYDVTAHSTEEGYA